MRTSPLNELIIGVKGAGEMASAVAWRLYKANLRRIFMLETIQPTAVRRMVSFCESVYTQSHTVEGVTAVRSDDRAAILSAWADQSIAVGVDPQWTLIESMQADVIVDAVLAKRNLGTSNSEAPLVIALGPGFKASEDAHLVVETNRGHHLGRIIESGRAAENTSIPGNIAGFSHERVLRAPADGRFETSFAITDRVKSHETIGQVGGQVVKVAIDGVIRGLIRPESEVIKGAKLGDIDPREETEFCYTISDKARAIAGSVLECILRIYNQPGITNNA